MLRSDPQHEGSRAVARYKVLVDDNAHYMEEDERSEYGTFDTLEEAVAACRDIVDRSLADLCRAGMTAAELYDRYTSFGDDPFIVALEGPDPKVRFSAWNYASGRSRQICP